jgi:hypothetical protein
VNWLSLPWGIILTTATKEEGVTITIAKIFSKISHLFKFFLLMLNKYK